MKLSNQMPGDGNAVRLSAPLLLVLLLVDIIRGTDASILRPPCHVRPWQRARPDGRCSKPRPRLTRAIGCEVPMNGNGLPYPEPLILNPTVTNLNGFAFKRPQLSGGDSKLVFSPGERVRLACTGPNNRFDQRTFGGAAGNDVTVSCVTGSVFKYRNVNYAFNRFKCSLDSLSESRTAASSSCTGSDKDFIEIGFRINQREFVKLIEICFHNLNLDVIWTQFHLLAEIGYQEAGFSRPREFVDDYFPFRAWGYYNRTKQLSTIRDIIGRAPAERFIKLQGDSFLSRGHLVASNDFLYNVQKLATYNMLNVAPQWQTFNGKNWNTAEMDTRYYAISRFVNLVVFTGIHGNEKLPDANNREHNIYLNREMARPRIKAPGVYWKVLYEPRSKNGIALVGVNNQFKNYATVMRVPGVDLCPGKHIRNDNWYICNAQNAGDQKLGFGYCCEVKDMGRAVGLPFFTVNGILT